MWRDRQRQALVAPRAALVLTLLRRRSSYAPPRRQSNFPLGSRNEKFIWQTHRANDTERYDVDVREAHAILGTEPNDTLARVKLNYLLRCRMFHPEAGGNAAMFYKITMAYERVLFDRGVECRHGRIWHSDTLGPRPEFDNGPLLEAGEVSAGALSSAGLEAETINGKPVPWANNEWQPRQEETIVKDRDDDEDEAPKEGDVPLTPWKLDEMRNRKEREKVATGIDKAAEFIARDTATKKEKQALLQAGAANGSPTNALVAGATGDALVEKHDPLADLLGPTDVIETDAAFHRDDAVVILKTPKRALFNQQPLSRLTNEQLMERWVTAPNRLTHDEEESTAREIIERNIKETGGALTKVQQEFLMTHLVERSDSVAGQAARAATDAMYHVEERRIIVREFMFLVIMVWLLGAGALVFWASYVAYARDKAEKPHLQEHISAETMLPWWGNDAEYERQVKRLFIEEWRRARGAAQRVTTFTSGVARESMSADSRYALDTEIFEVTSQRLDELRQRLAKGRDTGVVGEAIPERLS